MKTMPEYIERQKLINAIPIVNEDKQISLYGAVADFMVIALSIPTADVVEVVRCKECEYLLFDTEYCKLHNRGYCKFDDTIKQPNHFCGYGTRKEGAEE